MGKNRRTRKGELNLEKLKKLLYIITLVELTGRRSNYFDRDLEQLIKFQREKLYR
jgi:hypothetical protein